MILKAGVAHGLEREAWLERLKEQDQEMHAAVTREGEEGLQMISKLMRDRRLGKQLTEGIGEDGGPIDPPAYRALILSQSEEFLTGLKESDAAFHEAVTTEGDEGLEKMSVLMRKRKGMTLEPLRYRPRRPITGTSRTSQRALEGGR
jgi:molecular chaperone GrpE (heat shock protein)